MKNLIFMVGFMVVGSFTSWCQLGSEVLYINDFNTQPDDDYTTFGLSEVHCGGPYVCTPMIIDRSRALCQTINNNFNESIITFNNLQFTAYDSIIVSIDYKYYDFNGEQTLTLERFINNEWVAFSVGDLYYSDNDYVKKLMGGFYYNGEPLSIRVRGTDTYSESASDFCFDNFVIYGYKQDYCSIDSDGNGIIQMNDLLSFLMYYSYSIDCN
jgi:hypothetical protein